MPMWCPSCRADVAAELSTDNRRMLCARCHSELGVAATAISQPSKLPGAEEMERDARDLLSRWSSQSLLEPPSPVNTAFAKPTVSAETLMPKPDHQLVSKSPNSLLSSIPQSEMPKAPSNSSAFTTLKTHDEQKSPRDESTRLHSDDMARNVQTSVHHAGSAQPHTSGGQPVLSNQDRVTHESQHQPIRRAVSISTFVGQICAYAGVGLLTCGSVLAMWSFFGGPANYMPTGWLTAAVGQMLLFLGVVTLISSGMEHTIAEVTWRIDHLAEEIHHMGLALDHLEDEHRQARLGQFESQNRESRDDLARKAA